MLDEQVRERLAGWPIGRLATVNPAGRPHAVPCCFALDGGTVYFAVDEKPKRSQRLTRLANIQANPAVCLVVDHYEDDWSKLWWVRLDGQARIVEEGPERERGLALLTAKYAQYRENPPTGPVVVITVDRVRSWSGAGAA